MNIADRRKRETHSISDKRAGSRRHIGGASKERRETPRILGTGTGNGTLTIAGTGTEKGSSG